MKKNDIIAILTTSKAPIHVLLTISFAPVLGNSFFSYAFSGYFIKAILGRVGSPDKRFVLPFVLQYETEQTFGFLWDFVWVIFGYKRAMFGLFFPFEVKRYALLM